VSRLRRLLHVNKSFSHEGGVEEYLRRLSGAMGDWNHFLLAAEEDGRANYFPRERLRLLRALGGHTGKLSPAERVDLRRTLDDLAPDLIYFHHLPKLEVLSELRAYAPVVRFAHGEEVICANRQRFHAAEQKPCITPPGSLRCSLGCAFGHRSDSRHPAQLIRKASAVARIQAGFDHVDEWIVASQFMARSLESAGVASEKLTVVPYFIDHVVAANTAGEGILFVGRLVRVKGVHLLLDAVAMSPSLHLRIIGEGPEREALEKQAHDQGITDRVRFLGALPNVTVMAEIDACAVVAFPSIYNEPFGIVGIEGMARGKPVVAFAVGGVLEWLDHGRTGYALPPGDVEGFARHLVSLQADPDLLFAFGAAARERAGRFLPDHHLSQLARVFQRAYGE
jgi:glycosyltransferase involved in cell wall biosynthesis